MRHKSAGSLLPEVRRLRLRPLSLGLESTLLRLSFQPILSLTKLICIRPCLLEAQSLPLSNPQQNQNMNVVSITISVVGSRHFYLCEWKLFIKFMGWMMQIYIEKGTISQKQKGQFYCVRDVCLL